MQVKKKVLTNGLRIVAVEMEDNPTATVLVLVEAGSHYERKEQNGISHFLEHMCFKGTTKRPSPNLIAHELDALGAETNAFTSYEYTGYYAKARAKNFPKIFDVVADLYLNPTVPDAELQKEKGVIIEEINMYEDLPIRNVYRVLDRVMYGEQPAGRSILGTKEIIRGMKRDEFLNYRSKHYVSGTTAVIVAGDIDAKEVFSLVESHFSGVHKKKKPSKPKVLDTQKHPQFGGEYKKSNQAHFRLGFRSVPVHHKDVFATDVLKVVLGQGMSSRLFIKLREEMGVCYYVKAEAEYHSDHGKFVIASGVDISRMELVLKVIRDELEKLKNALVPQKEFNKAIELLLGKTLMDLEASDEVAEYYGSQEILHQPLMTPQEYIKQIRAVTPEQVRSVARKLFKNNNLNLAIIGPFKNAQQFKKSVQLS